MKTKTHRMISQKPAATAGATETSAQNGRLLTMPEAIQLLKTTRPTFYRWVRAGKIKAMKVGRQWRFHREDLERFLKGEAPRIELPVNITPLSHALREKIEKIGAKTLLEDISAAVGPVEEAVRLMIAVGSAMKSSDIHLTAHSLEGKTENTGVLRCRVDGVLQTIATFDVRLLPAIVQEWKRLASCDIHEKRKPQDGRIQFKVGGKMLDLRINFLPTCLGEMVTARILDASTARLELSRIDYAPQDMDKLRRSLKAPCGIILLTGPTGCGKTTALYSCLNELASPEIKVMSVEDPVEYILPWTTQVAIYPHLGLTFATALRAMLRSDPDVILIGEIRDRETLMVAHQVALTGHLVLTSLHTEEAAAALKRMVDIGSDPFLVADSTKLIIAQRLVRRLCPHCSVEETPVPAQLERVAELAQAGGLKWHTLAQKFRKSVGCEKCNHTGYRGRSVIAEMLEVTYEIGKALRNNASVEELRAIAVKQGMTTMAADGIRRAANGETSLQEILRVVAPGIGG